ncbi:MAG: glycosyltransferase family 39 protein [Xanthomonadales bacterium]|nr:glycosyltransferase family 39 protein [Xanthomonadales bacterium]ODU92025.1 MAG: glycosyl transferase [Rhodanobacter sp. SCN 66-43]OJY84919.1 MAG: glycosyl transferase [Xanthomonadales bacterium 66-474]
MTLASLARSERLRHLLWWLPLYLAAALLAIFLQPPVPLHSTRALAVAWDMWSHHQFWVPHINGAPYSEKAPLLFWLIHAGWAAFGVNDVWPRVLMVLIGAAQLVLAQALARRLFPERAWIARSTPWLLLGLSFGFLFGLQIMYDGLLAVWVLAAMLCLVPGPRRRSPSWIGFAVCTGLGLLTKGPVMLVHIAPVWLLGPWWCGWAREHRARWYGGGFAALLGGGAMLAAWVIPAVQMSGDAYTHNLLFKQTGGRVVDAFIHRRPFWWYVPWLAVLLFPFVLWPRMWAGIVSLRRLPQPGLRMLLAWLVPAFVIFSAFSGKQTYYFVPELSGAAIVMAAAIAALRAREGAAARSAWLSAWPLALGSVAAAVALFALPLVADAGKLHSHWLRDVSVVCAPFGVLYLLLGALVMLPGRGELRRIAIASLIGTVGAYALFALALYPAFDMRPAAQVLARAEAEGHAIGNLGLYDGQFEFAGRMTRPIERLFEGQALQDWAARHPRGLVIEYPSRLDADDLRYARLVQPYRGVWLVIWNAPTLAALRRGQQPPEPVTPTVLLPAPGYWRYGNVH